MAAVKTFSQYAAIPEGSTYQYRLTLTTMAGDPLPSANVIAIFLTLRDPSSGQIVNSRDHIAVKNINGGTYTPGLFVWQLAEGDTGAIGTEKLQPRRLTIDVHLFGGFRMTREVVFWVKAMLDIEVA